MREEEASDARPDLGSTSLNVRSISDVRPNIAIVKETCGRETVTDGLPEGSQGFYEQFYVIL